MKFLFFFYIFFAATLNAQTGNLISCDRVTRQMSQCTFASNLDASGQFTDFERVFKISYEFPCSGHQPDVGLMLSAQPHSYQKFVFNAPAMLVFTGKGKIVTVSQDSVAKFAAYRFNRECYLKVTQVNIDISPREIATVMTEISRFVQETQEQLTTQLRNLVRFESERRIVLNDEKNAYCIIKRYDSIVYEDIIAELKADFALRFAKDYVDGEFICAINEVTTAVEKLFCSEWSFEEISLARDAAILAENYSQLNELKACELALEISDIKPCFFPNSFLS